MPSYYVLGCAAAAVCERAAHPGEEQPQKVWQGPRVPGVPAEHEHFDPDAAGAVRAAALIQQEFLLRVSVAGVPRRVRRAGLAGRAHVILTFPLSQRVYVRVFRDMHIRAPDIIAAFLDDFIKGYDYTRTIQYKMVV